MSVSINFTFTQKGQAAVFNAQKTGMSLNLTHIQLGSGNKTPAGSELALLTPQQAVAIAAGSSVSNTQIRMSAIFSGTTNFNIGEIGLWSGDPAVSTSVLVAYWSQASGFLAVKSNGVDFVFSHDMVLNTAVPAGSLTILADQAQSAMLAAINSHEAKTDPHPQYTTDAEVMALIEARVGDYVVAGGTANAITAVLVPAITTYNANTAFAFKAAATNTGAITLDAGGGAKPLVREDGTPMQSGDVLAGMVVTVVYDVATTSFRSTEMVPSQVAGQIATAAQTQANTACTTAGTAPAFTTTPTPTLSALNANVRLRVKFHAASVGGDTLNVGGFGAKALKQYDSTGTKVPAYFSTGQLADVEYDGVDFVLLDPLPAATMPLSALQLPVIDNSAGMMPVTATAVAGNGGTVSLAAGTAFTLGMEVVAGASAFTQSCASAVWTSPALVANAEYFLRAQFVFGALTFYVQRGTLTDAEPASKKGTVNGAAGGGFYSTTLDICLARIVTGAAGTAPSVQKVINRRSISWSATLNGSGTIYLPIDPFTKTGRITSSNPTPHATLITGIVHGSGGWTGASYWYGAPAGAGGSTPIAAGSLYWVANSAILINSNNFVGDMTVSTCTGMFDHSSKNSMWQVFQSEHCLNDATGTYGDENLLGMGTKNMQQPDYDNGLAISYSNCVNALLTWEIVR